MKYITRPLLLGILCLAILPLISVNADIPKIVSYQGRIDTSGTPLDTSIDITFTLYSDSSGTTAVWSETHSAVQISDGLFDVLLGSVDTSGNPLSDSVFDNSDLFLGVQIGASSEIIPRPKLSSVPFAYHAATADVAMSVSQSGSDWFVGGDLSDLYSGSGEIAAYPTTEYEYGLKFNSDMIQRAICSKWNLGLRFYNIHPYFINSDNPDAGMGLGGVIFYIDTNSPNDDGATPTNWRQGYWYIDYTDATTPIKIQSSIGYFPLSVYCRKL